MNKNLLFLLSICILFANCKKEDSVINTDPILSSSYQPVTKGSYWKFQVTTGSTVGPVTTTTMTGNSKTINNKLYNEASTTTAGSTQNSIGYFYNANNIYTMRSTTLIEGITVEFEYLNDAAKVNDTWIKNVSDDGLINGVPARIIGKIKEKDITKTINGNVFNNVIHTELQLQYNISNGFETSATYDFYIAKGIGIIQSDASVDYYGLKVSSSSKLIEYSIK